MNTLTLVVLGVVAWMFFLSGSSFLFLLSLAVLLLYSLVEVGGERREHHHHAEQVSRSGDPGGDGAKMNEAAGMLGTVVNIFGSFFGKLIKGALFAPPQPEKKTDSTQKMEIVLKKR